MRYFSRLIARALSVLLRLFPTRLWRQLSAMSMRAGTNHRAQVASLTRMSAVLAHEIRNPLASLKGHAQLLDESLEPGSVAQKRAERVVQEALRLERIVLQLLELMRSGRVVRETVDLCGLIQDMVEEETGSGRVTFSSSEPEVRHRIDPVRFRQALSNLVRNAQDFSPEDAPVEIELESDEGFVCIFVRDRGVGIPPGEEERIFEPFYTHRVTGVGLGLAISRQIVELHDGTLHARNRREGGAEFCISMPRG